MSVSKDMNKASSGFTLLEVLVTLSIFSLITLVSMQLLFQVTKTNKVLSFQSDSTQQLILAKQSLKVLFRNIVMDIGEIENSSSKYINNRIQRKNIFIGGNESLEFYSKFSGDMNQIGIYDFKIFIDKELNALQLAWTKPGFAKSNFQTESANTVLIEEVTNLKISYWSKRESEATSKDNTWLDRWNDVSPPDLVRLLLDQNNKRQEIIINIGA